jgi:membrane carboxypeptidase/penicillin-binding protein PbpC
MRHVSGITGAAPIWRDVMEELHKGRPVRQFARPAGITEKVVCADNGLLPVEPPVISLIQNSTFNQPSTFNLQPSQAPASCQFTLTEKFIAGLEPQRRDDWHQTIALDRRTGLRAGPGCPPDVVTLQTYTLYPAEAMAWALKRNMPQPPDDYSPLCPNESARQRISESANNGNNLIQPSSLSLYPLLLTSPDQGSVFRLVPYIPADKQQIRVSVRPTDGVQARQVRLLVNGQPLATGWQTLWPMTPGRFTFEAVGVDAQGNEIRSNQVSIEVKAFD